MDSAPFQSGGSLLQAKLLLPLVGVLLLISGIAAVVVLDKTTQDTRRSASTGAGTVTLTFNPGSSLLPPNTRKTIDLQTNTGLERLFGYEVVVDFTGTVPSDFSYTPAAVAGLSTAPDPSETPLVFVPTSTGRRLSFGLLTPISPRTAFTTSNATVTLGSISFTTPTSGSMKVSIVPQLSRAIRFNATSSDTTETDVLKTPVDYTYTFGVAPTPTSRPTSTPAPSGFPSQTPGYGQGGSPSPRATPTPSPIAKQPCYGTAITVGGTLSWPNACRGVPTTAACLQVITPLTTTEIAAYTAWVNAGRPAITGCPAVTPAPTPTPVAKCTDSDGGRSYTTAGTLTYTNNPNGVLTENDSCDGNTVIEGVCNSQTDYTKNHERYACPNGCSGGKCMSITISTPTPRPATPTPVPTVPPTPRPTPIASSTVNRVTVSIPNGGQAYVLDQSVATLSWKLEMVNPALLTAPAQTTLIIHPEGKLFGDGSTAVQITNGAFTQVGTNSYTWKVAGLAPGRYQLEVLVWKSPNNVLGTLRDFSDVAFTVGATAPTPRPTAVPTPTPVPFDRVINQQQWDALPGWVRTWIRNLLGV